MIWALLIGVLIITAIVYVLALCGIAADADDHETRDAQLALNPVRDRMRDLQNTQRTPRP